MSRTSIILAETPEDIEAVKSIFIDYLSFIEDYLGQSLGFQGTDAEFATFPDRYDALFLAKLGGHPVAACGVKPLKDDICELKRLYCRPKGRGHNFGTLLTVESLKAAKTLGYKQMYLDTDPGLTHANKIYETLGFKDIDRYYDNPMSSSRYMGVALPAS